MHETVPALIFCRKAFPLRSKLLSRVPFTSTCEKHPRFKELSRCGVKFLAPSFTHNYHFLRTQTERSTEVMAGRTTILIVEDDPADVFFLEKAFERILTNCAVHRVCDGEEARTYLQGTGKFADRKTYPLPSVILLDLRMPRMNGFEFLSWLRSEAELKIIPTVVYSSSENPADIRKAYEMGANSFLHKRLSMNAVQETMRSFARYWLEDCGRPPLD